MTTPSIYNKLIDEIRARFVQAADDHKRVAALQPESWGAGYNRGYADALGELFEHITGDPPITSA